MADHYNNPLHDFEADLDLPEGFTTRQPATHDEHASAAIRWLEKSKPGRQRFWPALTLAFVAQAEALLNHLGKPSQPDVFDEVERKRTSAIKAVDQLVWVSNEREIGTRRYYNMAEDAIISKMRRQHPSTPAHATSKWEMYRPFISSIFAATPEGRTAVAEWIWEHGVLAAELTLTTAFRKRQPRPFYEMLESLDTGSGTTGGALFQALVYGYLYADSPTLTVTSQRVNTGSRRAKVIGDVSGYLGENIVLAAEAKDKDLTHRDKQDLLTFVREADPFPDLDAVVFARSFDTEIREFLESSKVRTFPRDEMLKTVRLWDVPKQENAVRAVRFFLGRIQQSNELLQRVIDFEQGVYERAQMESDG